jgi:hypothetical protein
LAKKQIMLLTYLWREKMMKKVLVLLAVLGISSVCSAAFQISVEGDLNPGDDIQLSVNETAIIGIWTDAMIPPDGGFRYLIGVEASVGQFDYAQATFHKDIPTKEIVGSIWGDWPDSSAPEPPTGYKGFRGSAFTVWASVPAGTVLIGNVVFQCAGEGDAVIRLYNWPASGPIEEFDSVTIHQNIPEPGTFTVLALGGLMLARLRRKR